MKKRAQVLSGLSIIKKIMVRIKVSISASIGGFLWPSKPIMIIKICTIVYSGLRFSLRRGLKSKLSQRIGKITSLIIATWILYHDFLFRLIYVLFNSWQLKASDFDTINLIWKGNLAITGNELIAYNNKSYILLVYINKRKLIFLKWIHKFEL